MYRIYPHTVSPLSTIQLDCKQDVGGLRLSIGDELVAVRRLKIGVLPDHIARKVPSARQIDDAARRCSRHRRHLAIGERKVALVVSAKLRLKSIRRVPLRGEHNPCVIHQAMNALMMIQ